jgi:hypothetical protein
MEIVARSSKSPVRAYAHDAVAAVAHDQRQGVLIWRWAEHLLQQFRSLSNRPIVRLDDVPPNEQQFYLDRATTLLAIESAIDTTAPPTAGEIRRHEERQALGLARARVRHDAARLGHELDVWRPGEPGYQLAFCRRCRAGGSIHVATAAISVSAQLTASCQPLTR